MDGIVALKKAKGYTDTAIAALPKGVVYKGAVSYEADLPTTGNTKGDCYTVKYKGTSGTEAWGAEFVWGTYEGVDQWVKFGGGGTISAVDGTPSSPVSINADTLNNHADTYFATAEQLSSKADKALTATTLPATAVVNTIYVLGSQSAITTALPTGTAVGDIICIIWNNGATPATVTITGSLYPFSYTPTASKRSEINAMWDGAKWALVSNEMAVS